MCNDVSLVRVNSIFKIAISIFLCFCIIVLPFIQRSYAVVTTTTVVVILILTLLTAMGITLVIAEGSKEAFIEQKGDEFMQSKGYSGNFADWIKGQSDIQIGLKVGFLMLAKDVVDRIKEFVNWLIPGAASNTVVNLGTGEAVPTSAAIIQGTFSQGTNQGYLTFHPSSVLVSPVDYSSTYSDGNNTISFSSATDLTYTGYYTENNTFVSTGEKNFSINRTARYSFFRNTQPFVASSGMLFPVGIYLVFNFESASASNVRVRNVYGNSNGLLNYRAFLQDAYMSQPEVPASAIIGDLDDLSDLTQTTVSENGTTTIYNTFYITQDGQALQTGQDIADIVGALQQALEDLNRKLEVIPQTAETAAEGTITPNYSDFDLGELDLSGLGALLTTRFPFSIPWDIIRIFQTFVAEPEAPSWTVDLLPIEQFENVNTEITIDLGQYPLVGNISRYFCIIELCIGLCYITKRLVWTA